MTALAQFAYHPLDNYQQRTLRQRLDIQIDRKKLFSTIDSDPELIGAGVVYIDSHYTIVTLREFEPICNFKPVKVVLREPPHTASALQYARDLTVTPRESKLLAEVLGATLSCGAAVLSWVVIIGSIGAIPLTGGTSTALTVVSYSAFAASALQCGNGIVRIGLEGVNPGFKDQLDTESWYQAASYSLDLISLGGAGASGFLTMRMVQTFKSQGLTTRAALEGLTRAQRARLTEEIVRINHPTASRKMIKYLKTIGAAPKRYTRTQISSATQRQLKDALGAIFSVTGSASSGVVRSLAVGIYQEVN